MQVKRDWIIEFDEEQYIAFQGEVFVPVLKNPGWMQTFREAVAEMSAVIQPAACWDFFPIEKFLHEKLVLADGTRLGGGPVTTVMGGAEQLIVAVCTVGAGADRLIDISQKKKDYFKTMILHDVASWGVDLVRQQVCQMFEIEAKENGLRVSAPLSPGESVWSVEEQAILFSLLDTEQIEVTLTPSMIMVPLKSLSLIVGIGSQPMGVEGASNCDFCTIKERCNYRQMRLLMLA